MKRIQTLFILLLIIPFGQLKAQVEIDGYIHDYETATVDEKIALFFLFSSELTSHYNDSILYYAKDLQEEGLKNNREDAIALANWGLAPYLQKNSLFEQTTNKLNSALKYYSKVRNDTMVSSCYNILGNTFYLQGKVNLAEAYYEKSAKIVENIEDIRHRMVPLYNLARVYVQQGKYEEAKKNLDVYFVYLKDYDLELSMKSANAYGLLGQLYLDQQNYPKAIESYTHSMEVGLTVGNMKTVANGYTNMAIVEFYTENYDRSEQYFRLALSYRIKDNNLFYISEGYYNLGDYFYGIGKLDSALTNYQLSVDVAKEGNNLLFQKDGLVQISSIYDSLKKHEEHVLVLKQIVDIQEELSKQRFSEEFKALKMSYEQSYNEAISIGGMREQELETKVGAIESVFNNWLVISVLCFLGFMTFIFLLKRSKNK